MPRIIPHSGVRNLRNNRSRFPGSRFHSSDFNGERETGNGERQKRQQAAASPKTFQMLFILGGDILRQQNEW